MCIRDSGYGVHHISDDGKYLIMGNGTRAFAVAAEQPEKDNPLRTEMCIRDSGKMIDEIAFCGSFLHQHPMKCVRGRLFTVDGMIEDERCV